MLTKLTKLENKPVDIAAVNVHSRARLGHCISSGVAVRLVVELAATRLRMACAACNLQSLRIWRKRELLPVDRLLLRANHFLPLLCL